MKWLSRRIRAISPFSLETGISTRRWPAAQAFRTRVSISATGSVTLIVRPLPAGFAHAGNLPAQRELTEADPAQLELAQRTAAAAAPLAAVVAAHLELGGPFDLLNPTLLGHGRWSPRRPRRGLRPGRAYRAPGAAPWRCRPGRRWSRT